MSNKKKLLIGFALMIIAMLFGIGETIYFGNNLLPQSQAEFICDMAVLCIAYLGVSIVVYYWMKALENVLSELIDELKNNKY